MQQIVRVTLLPRRTNSEFSEKVRIWWLTFPRKQNFYITTQRTFKTNEFLSRIGKLFIISPLGQSTSCTNNFLFCTQIHFQLVELQRFDLKSSFKRLSSNPTLTSDEVLWKDQIEEKHSLQSQNIDMPEKLNESISYTQRSKEKEEGKGNQRRLYVLQNI